MRDGYGRACGCTASHAHVRAIARADDAAVAITCARGYVRRYILPTHMSYMNIYLIGAKSGYVNGYARVCSCIRVRSRAGANDALIRGMCASATGSLRKAIEGKV